MRQTSPDSATVPAHLAPLLLHARNSPVCFSLSLFLFLLVLFFPFPFLSFLHSFLTPDSFIHFFSSLFLSHSPTIVVCPCRVITQLHFLYCRSGKFFYNPCCSPTSVAITFFLGFPHLSKNKSLLFSSLSRELLLSFHSFSYKGLRSS